MPTPLQILSLEDDPLDTELALETLRRDGLDPGIERVVSLPEFEAALKRPDLDLILADYRVPGVDALQALQLARKLRPDVPYVFLSGTIPEDLAIETLKLGATDYVFKQRMDRLAPAVRRALRETAEQTRRREAEDEAKMFKFFSEFANDGHLLFNEKLQILYGNQFACEKLGYSREDLRQLRMPDIDTMFPIERTNEFFNQLKEGRAAPIEGLHKRKDGSMFPVELTFAVLENQEETLIFATCRDITHRKQAEAALQASEQEARALSRSLEQRVRERTSELEDKTLRLRRLAAELTATEQRERKRLAALLHDDLQQLLVAANMHLKQTGRRLKDESDRQAVEKAAKWLAEATTSARELTHQLRPPALYEDGLLAGLHGLSLEVKERYQLTVNIEEGEIKSALNDDTNALLFECIRELLFNVVNHAGVGEAFVRVWEEDGCLRIIVRDRGKGLVPHQNELKRSSPGDDLFSIKERLAAFGGTVDVDSGDGQGTEVAINLPLVPEVLKETSRGGGLVNSSRKVTLDNNSDGRVTILVVDDHAMIREGLATLLKEDPRLSVVGEASDGFAAIEAVETHQPDVLLIDVNMPRMNGIEAAREVHRRWPGTVIIGLSVQDDDTTAKAMRDAGASAFLSKVGNSDQMIATIVALCEMAFSAKGAAMMRA